jgi:hypothetical protein
MANMGYCRFQLTLGDLEECEEHMEDDLRSEDEKEARKDLIALCVKIAEQYGELAES